MRLYDVLENVPAIDICRYQRQHGRTESGLTEEQQAVLYEKFIKELKSVEPKEDNEGYLVICDRRNSLAEGTDKMEKDVFLFFKNDLMESKREIFRISEIDLDENISVEAAKEEEDSINHNAVNGTAFEFAEWDEILGWQISEGNIKEAGMDAFLGIVLFAMSCDGFCKSEREEKRKEFYKNGRNLIGILEKPSSEDLLQNDWLFETFGLTADDIGKTDNEDEKRIRILDRVWNEIETAKTLRKIIAEET